MKQNDFLKQTKDVKPQIFSSTKTKNIRIQEQKDEKKNYSSNNNKEDLIQKEELKQKINKEKRILKSKIVNARKKVYSTGKQSEIDRVNKEIYDFLLKHRITEEDLKDDYIP